MEISSTLKRFPVGVALLAAALLLLGWPVAGSARAGGRSPRSRTRAPRTVTGATRYRTALDPQVAWSNYGLSTIYDTYIPLLTYRHAGGVAGSEVIPGLARSLPRISNGGRTYTLQLRRGLRYSNGEPVRASDFKSTVERLFRVDEGDGSQYFYDDIVGARRLELTGRGGLPGITTDDRDGRIVIHLIRPEGSFARKLAMTFVAPVPAGTPDRNLSLNPPPATGPYVITHSSRGGWTYERDREWFGADHREMPDIPSGHLEKIAMKVIRDPRQEVKDVESGRIDWISTELAPRTAIHLRRTFPTRFRLEPNLGTEYLWLNTSKAPFDDVRVRQALNYAVSRGVFARLAGGQVAPSQQILPPGLPGFERFDPYPYDFAKARRLIAAADPSGGNVTVGTYIDESAPEAFEDAVYLVATLDRLGFTAHLRVLPRESYFEAIQGPAARHLDAGVAGYFANYPSPDDFFGETLGSRPAASYDQNPSRLFVPSLVRRTEALASRPESTATERGYAALDRAYTRLAPWVPIGSNRTPLFVSGRIDAGEIVSNPSFGVDLTSLRLRRGR